MRITRGFLLRVALKALFLFAAVNFLFAVSDPLSAWGRLSIYNRLVPGRVRLPFGSFPDTSYNLTLSNVEAMFASHEIAAGPKPPAEFRILLIGDSSIWGALLTPEQTRTALLTGFRLETDGRNVRCYNLGYPTLSLMKDLLILHRALAYEPDLIVWTVTLESMLEGEDGLSQIVLDNPAESRRLISRYALPYDPQDPSFDRPSVWDRTVIGSRRELADLIRLQIYGFAWAATGVDVYIPEDYERPANDLPETEEFHGFLPGRLQREDLAWEVLDAGRAMAGGVPILFVNEPIYRSDGRNSDIRYNAVYPRWVYDRYLLWMSEYLAGDADHYLDLWDFIPADDFTNSSIHLSPAAEAQVAGRLAEQLTILPVMPADPQEERNVR